MLSQVAGATDPRRRLDSGAGCSAGGKADRDELGRRLRALASMLRDLA